jgi:hypothetical protein
LTHHTIPVIVLGIMIILIILRGSLSWRIDWKLRKAITDGVIFISVDDNEYTYLRSLLDDVFGKEKIWKYFSYKSKTRE